MQSFSGIAMPAPSGWSNIGQEKEKQADFLRFTGAQKSAQGLVSGEWDRQLAQKLDMEATGPAIMRGAADPSILVAPWAQHDYNGPPANLAESFGLNAQAGAIRAEAAGGDTTGYTPANPSQAGPKTIGATAFSHPYNGGQSMPNQSGQLGPYGSTDINSNNNVNALRNGNGWVSMPNPTPEQQANPSHLPGGVFLPDKYRPEHILAYAPFDQSDRATESGPDIMKHYANALGNGQEADPQWANDPRNPYAGMAGKGGRPPAYARFAPHGMGY